MNSHAGAWELGVSWEDIFCVLPKLSLAGLSRLKWVAKLGYQLNAGHGRDLTVHPEPVEG